MDDEEVVHESWKSKLALVNPSAKIHSFRNQERLFDWFDSCDDFSGHLFFFDSDLGGNKETGESLG
ncbi:MAG: hypothetical protein MK008_13415, partial [Bdellovibrionales bacterium]|nr:hypothetical protein [Bdellovibrionales bacterium]